MVFGKFALVSTYSREVLQEAGLDVKADPDADEMPCIELVDVFCTFELVSTYFGKVGQDLFFYKNFFT